MQGGGSLGSAAVDGEGTDVSEVVEVAGTAAGTRNAVATTDAERKVGSRKIAKFFAKQVGWTGLEVMEEIKSCWARHNYERQVS